LLASRRVRRDALLTPDRRDMPTESSSYPEATEDRQKQYRRIGWNGLKLAPRGKCRRKKQRLHRASAKGTSTDRSILGVEPIFRRRFGHGRIAKVFHEPGPDFRLTFDRCVQASQNGEGRALAAPVSAGFPAQVRTNFTRFSAFFATICPPAAGNRSSGIDRCSAASN
jgi:hypothetical protein